MRNTVTLVGVRDENEDNEGKKANEDQFFFFF